MSPRHPRAAGSAPRSHRLTKLPKGKKIKASRTARSNTRAAEHRALVQQQAENNENRALPNRRFVLIPPRQYVAELNAGRRVIIVDSTNTDRSNAQAPTAERVVVPDLPEHSNADSQNPNDILDIGGELSDIE